MLYFEWKEEDALKYAKEEGYEDGFEDGEQKKQEELIRKFSKKLSPEDIAETLQTSKEYVLEVLDQDICACEPERTYGK